MSAAACFGQPHSQFASLDIERPRLASQATLALCYIAPRDAASVAGLLITTEAMVGEKPEKKAGPSAPGGMGGGMGGMGDMDF